MITEIREYNKPVTADSIPTRTISIEDPAFFKQERKTLGEVTTTVFGTLQGSQVYASRGIDNMNQHIDPRNKGILHFDSHHTEIIVEKR